MRQRRRRGQGAIEYVVIVGLVGAAATFGAAKFAGALRGGFNAATGKVDEVAAHFASADRTGGGGSRAARSFDAGGGADLDEVASGYGRGEVTRDDDQVEIRFDEDPGVDELSISVPTEGEDGRIRPQPYDLERGEDGVYRGRPSD